MAILLRVVAGVILFGVAAWGFMTVFLGQDCSRLISHAPSYNACMQGAPTADTYVDVAAVVGGGVVTALILLALAKLMSQRRNG